MKKNVKCEFLVDGMKCDSCELYMENILKKQAGVVSATAKSSTQKVHVVVDELTDVEDLKQKLNDQIAKQGYRIVDTLTVQRKNEKMVALSAILAVSLFVAFLLMQKLNLTSLLSAKTLTLPAIFFLGVLASLSSCMAIVGGVAMTLSSKFASEKRNKAIVVFHVARLVGFIVLGGVIGLLGKMIVVSATMSAVLRIIVALVMLGIGLDMTGVSVPKLVFPKKIAELFGVFEDKDGWNSAVLLGVVTFFLPCAFTQSMQLYAISAGSFIQGAMVMGAFALGTLPVLGLVSFGSTQGVVSLRQGLFGNTMAFLIILFALLNLYSALVTLGLFPQFLL